MSKTDYAKYQFMILVLRALFMLLTDKFLKNKTNDDSAWELINGISMHVHYIEDLMKEE